MTIENTIPTAALVFADGTIIYGHGLGAAKTAVGEICFNTAMTGYQEIMTDPSYTAQIITFTFPHIGNVGTNGEDIETRGAAGARGMIIREDITQPSSFRAREHLDAWLKANGLPAISGVDTRALTQHIRDHGAPNGVLCHAPDGKFDIPALQKMAQAFPGLDGLDLAKEVSCTQSYAWREGEWSLADGYQAREGKYHVVAMDFGAKLNILRCLVSAGCNVTVVPATASYEDIMAKKPDGVFLSNGPGDPAATGKYAVPVIQKLLNDHMPIFGICLGHQLLALALGARTQKMNTGHRGANHPVKDMETGKVEITSQNHGFQVLAETLPANAMVTHTSLFDGTNEGLRLTDKPVFSVQYHPEASPGPHDSHYLFERFVAQIAARG